MPSKKATMIATPPPVLSATILPPADQSAILHFEPPAKPADTHPISDLAIARALPEVPPGECDPVSWPEQPHAIRAFKDEDGRTMSVASTPAGLVKTPI